MPFGWIAGSAVVSGLLGANAAQDAANTTANATNNATATQMAMYQQTAAGLEPWRAAGVPALQMLMYLTGVGKSKDDFAKELRASGHYSSTVAGPQLWGGVGSFGTSYDEEGINREATRLFEMQSSQPGFGSLSKPFSLNDFQKEPGYEFRRAEGEKAIERGALARGVNSSSATMKSLAGFNQDLASTEYQAAYGRNQANKSNTFNLLSYLSGSGQNAAAMTGQAGVNTAAGVSQALMTGASGQANATMAGASSINNAVQGGLGNMMYQQRWNQQMDMWKGVFSPSGTGTGMVGSTGGLPW